MGYMLIAMIANTLDHFLSLKYPASPPRIFPIIQDISKVVKSKKTVQEREFAIISMTGVGNMDKDGPKSRAKRCFQKAKYCSS